MRVLKKHKVFLKLLCLLSVQLFCLTGHTVNKIEDSEENLTKRSKIIFSVTKIDKKKSFKEKAWAFYTQHRRKIIIGTGVVSIGLIIGGIIVLKSKNPSALVDNKPKKAQRVKKSKKLSSAKKLSSIRKEKSKKTFQYSTHTIENFFNLTKEYAYKKERDEHIDRTIISRQEVMNCYLPSFQGTIVYNNRLEAHAEFLESTEPEGIFPTVYVVKSSVLDVAQAIQQQVNDHIPALMYVTNGENAAEFASIVPDKDNKKMQELLKNRGAAVFLKGKSNDSLPIVAVNEKTDIDFTNIKEAEVNNLMEEHIKTFSSVTSIMDNVVKPQTFIVPGIFNKMLFTGSRHSSMTICQRRSNIKNIILCYPETVSDEDFQTEKDNFNFLRTEKPVHFIENIATLLEIYNG